MSKLSLTIPGSGGTPIQIDSGLPTGVPTGGLFNKAGNAAGTGINVIWTSIEVVLIGAVLLSLYQIIRGGINIASSGGDKQRLQNGRETLRWGIIGLIIIFMSFFMVNIIGAFFGFNLLSFSK